MLELTHFPSTPPLIEEGFNPWLILKPAAIPTYLAYFQPRQFIEKYLEQHERESYLSYQKRSQSAYSLGLIERLARRLIETIASERYPITRDFGEYTFLLDFANQYHIWGGSLEQQLKSLSLHALLGGIAYLYLDQNTYGPIDDIYSQTDKHLVEKYQLRLLKANQVSNIVFSSSGEIIQCQIYGQVGQMESLIRYQGRHWWQWHRPQGFSSPSFHQSSIQPTSDWQLVADGEQQIDFAPLLPLTFKGHLEDEYSLSSPLHALINMEKAIINKISDKDHALRQSNFPQYIMPVKGEHIYNFVQDNDNTRRYSTFDVGPHKVLIYDQEAGEPKFLEANSHHVDVTWNDISRLIRQAEELIGVNIEHDQPLASGVAKAFSHQALNETRRNLHHALQNVEYRLFYTLFRLRGYSLSFPQFKQKVSIAHPTDFSPQKETSIVSIN